MMRRFQYLKPLQEKYLMAKSRKEKSAILDKYCGNTGQNRKYVIRKLRSHISLVPKRRGGKPVIYDGYVKAALAKTWDIFDCPCGQRLAPLLKTEVDRLRQLSKIERYKPAKSLKICDTGCAFGFFLKMCEQYSYRDTYGVDISEYAIKHAKSYVESKLILHDISKAPPLPQELFGVITCFEVLEHLRNPGKAVEFIAENLDWGGILVISTPNRGLMHIVELFLVFAIKVCLMFLCCLQAVGVLYLKMLV